MSGMSAPCERRRFRSVLSPQSSFERRGKFALLEGEGDVAPRSLQHAPYHVGGAPQAIGYRVGVVHRDKQGVDVLHHSQHALTPLCRFSALVAYYVKYVAPHL